MKRTIFTLFVIAALFGFLWFLIHKTASENPKPDPKADFAPECEWCDP